MQFYTAISKLTILATRSQTDENACLKIIDILSKYSINIEPNGRQIQFNTVENVLKNLVSKVYENNQKIMNIGYNVDGEFNKYLKYSPDILTSLAQLEILLAENKTYKKDFQDLFSNGIEAKLNLDLQDLNAFAQDIFERSEKLDEFERIRLENFPFMRVAQEYIKQAVSLNKTTDIDEISNSLYQIKPDLLAYKNFIKVNEKYKIFNEKSLSPLHKATDFANSIKTKKENELKAYHSWDSMLFRD